MKTFPYVVRAAAVAALSLIASTSADAAPTVQSTATGLGDRGVLYRGDRLTSFVQATKTRRVDVAGIGDSNQLFTGGVGIDGGVQAGWQSAVGLYGSGVLTYNSLYAWGSAGQGVSGGSPWYGINATPTQFAPVTLGDVSGFPAGHGYQAPGTTLDANTTRAALYLDATTPWGAQTEQRWHWTHGTFTEGGTFAPSARLANSNTIVASKTVSTAGAAGGLVDDFLAIPANSGALWLEPTRLSQQGVDGGFYAHWQRVESPGTTRGVAYSTLLAQGGQSTRFAAQSLAAAPDAALREWMRQTTRLQNVGTNEQRLMIQIIQGGNDLNDATPAFNSAAPTNTPAGYAANLSAVIGRLQSVWNAAGYDPTKLNIVIGAYHGRPTDQVPDYVAFEQAAMGVADNFAGVSVLRGTRLFSYTTMNDNGWYFTPGDYPHLSNAGYYGTGRIMVNQLVSVDADRSDWSIVSSLRAQLSEDVTGLTTANLTLTNLTTGQTIDTQDMTLYYDPATDLAEWTFPGLPGGYLPLGEYQMTINAPGMTAPFTGVFTAIPEPATAGFMAVGGLGLLSRRRRRAVTSL